MVKPNVKQKKHPFEMQKSKYNLVLYLTTISVQGESVWDMAGSLEKASRSMAAKSKGKVGLHKEGKD